LNLGEVAAALRVSRPTLNRILQKGGPPTVRIGERQRVLAKDLEAWLERQRAANPGATHEK